MTKTLLVCGRCGKTEEFNKAITDGWLHSQRKGKPEGYVIIRCPGHISKHALWLAGLPQQVTSKRIEDNLDRGLYVECGNKYSAYVWRDLDDPDLGTYVIHCYKEEMPPFKAARFDTIGALIQEMRRVEKDLRKWKLQTV